MLIGSAGRACLYTERSTIVPPNPAKITIMQTAQVVNEYVAACGVARSAATGKVCIGDEGKHTCILILTTHVDSHLAH